MKLKFKIQQYQTDAVQNVVKVFNGQPNKGLAEYIVDKGKTYIKENGKLHEVKAIDFDDHTGYKNGDVVLSRQDLLNNIHQIQAENNIRMSSDLVDKLGCCQLDIEMETGTGKTYVYIKTMFELNKLYGWTKFIVVVPSVAIREGVKKSFDITGEHFMELYGKKARYFIYNSDNLNQIDTFAQSSDINVMIINTQAFNTSMKEGAKNAAARIIYSVRDEFASRKPIDVIAANHPIIILDEPQKMGGIATQTALTRFNPLFTLNYSATHKETHNPVYVLDALDAYNQKLVKKIEVVGFELKNLKGTDGYMYLEDILLSKKAPPKARIEIEVKHTNNIKREIKNLNVGDDLFYSSNELEQYRGYTISDIHIDTLNSSHSTVSFANGKVMYIKDVYGDISAEHKARIQIRETIRAHFRKESALFKRGIKCLSLFFLDEVANYRRYNEDNEQVLGKYGEMFEEEYIRELNNNQNMFDPDYISYLGAIPAKETHAGYFSIDKKGRSVNSEVKRGSDQSDDTSAYDLILKNKERLLSFDESVRFIFSHSALREGWDNPNVFQICSLRQSNSISQKRQEVGRGLRLCVDQHGVRMDAQVEDLTSGEIIQKQASQTERLSTNIVSNVKYDLIGKIASGTTLTRRTVATILSKIRPAKFLMFKANPEEFISKVTRLILEQKATMIVDHISYNLVDGEYDSSIFTQEKHTSMDKAFRANKSIQDYVFTDGTAEKSNERIFVENLDTANEVVVYAKLPKGFHIPTPVGNYTPDWAIAFEQGKVKHVYFVAETKGSMSSMELREIEKNKIACAEKLFEQLSTAKIKYGKVDSFDTLLNLVK